MANTFIAYAKNIKTFLAFLSIENKIASNSWTNSWKQYLDETLHTTQQKKNQISNTWSVTFYNQD